MTAEITHRTTVDLLQLRAILAVLTRLQAFAPDLVVTRGSTAVYAHAPLSSRIPNDLDIFWLGDSSDVEDLIGAATARPGVRATRTRLVPSPDPRISALHRVDLLVWLGSAQQPSHRLWVDVGTSRRIIAARQVSISVTPQSIAEASVVEVHETLAEKLWVYVESATRDRTDLRWNDLFDMIALVISSAELQRYSPVGLRTACARYFGRRGSQLPRWVPEPPREWRSVWHRLVGPVADRAPSLDAAWYAVRTFWRPVLGDGSDCDFVRWNPSCWSWEGTSSNGRSTPFLLGNERHHLLDFSAM
jgi:hypothetical protein